MSQDTMFINTCVASPAASPPSRGLNMPNNAISEAEELLPRRQFGGPIYCWACWNGFHDDCEEGECPCHH